MMQQLQTILTFIVIFGMIVAVHEYGHLYFAKKAGILVREFAIGMGPKIFAYVGKDGTVYTIRILPLGGYVRLAGWGDDSLDIETGSMVGLTLDDQQVVSQISLKSQTAYEQFLPLRVTSYDLEKSLSITGEFNGELKTFEVAHDATVIESDGTQVRIAPLDVQYASASVWGRMMTNFAGPMNSILFGMIAMMLAVFIQGSVQNTNSNQITVLDKDLPAYQAGLRTNDTILSIAGEPIKDWQDMTQMIGKQKDKSLEVVYQREGKKAQVSLKPKSVSGQYLIGISPKTDHDPLDMLEAGFVNSLSATTAIIVALKNLVIHPDINQLGGPVAMYQMTGAVAKNGLASMVSLMGMLSINIGLFNLLIPIPALDGGKILLNVIEAIRRKPMKAENEAKLTLVGAGALVILMIAVTWHDILRLF